jgi:hypothetical protein
MRYLIVLFITACLFASGDFNIETLRKDQSVELKSNIVKFREKAQGLIFEGEYHGHKKEQLLKEYSKSRNNIIKKYKTKDKYRVDELKVDLNLNGGLTNTGSYPRNANADVDIVANNKEAFEKQKKVWKEKYGKENIKVEGYKITNTKTDTVMWKAESLLSPTERKLIRNDHDAYITSGGKHSTSVRSKKIKSSAMGSGLDPIRKLTYGMKHGIIKDVGKSLVKITTAADGKDLIAHIENGTLLEHKSSNKAQLEENKLLKKASDLKQYKDTIETGIVDLSDSPSMAKQKEQEFGKKALDLALNKQKKLDMADQRKKRIYKHMISTFAEGSEKRVELEEKLKISEKTNQYAREKVNNALEYLGVKKRLAKAETIVKAEEKLYQRREQTRDIEKQKILEKANERKSKKKIKIKKRTKVSGVGVASFLVSAYQINENLNNTIKAGGNDFVTINKDDSQLAKNIKAGIGMGIESTTFGGAFSSGKRADEEEKKRIMDAIKKGKTVNPLLSFARATFWGLSYIVKDATLGSLEYTKNKLLEVDQEIKGLIKSKVREKYAKIRADEQSKKVAAYKTQHKAQKKQSRNKKWDNYLAQNKKKLQKNKKFVLADLEKKLEKEKKKADNIQISKDVFSNSFAQGEKKIQEYRDKVTYIEKTKKETEQIKKETAATQKRIDEQWDSFKEGLAIVGQAVGKGAIEYQKSTKSHQSQNDSWKEDDDIGGGSGNKKSIKVHRLAPETNKKDIFNKIIHDTDRLGYKITIKYCCKGKTRISLDKDIVWWMKSMELNSDLKYFDNYKLSEAKKYDKDGTLFMKYIFKNGYIVVKIQYYKSGKQREIVNYSDTGIFLSKEEY